MKDLYLIDGYNVIFWLPEEFPRTDLESSRKKLVDLMQDYGAHNDVEVIVVFDGNSRSLKAKVETISPFFHVVYTPLKMTADSYIEMESYKRRDEYRSIFVVTSDGAEQNQVLGNGAYRMAVSDLVRFPIWCGCGMKIRKCRRFLSAGIIWRIHGVRSEGTFLHPCRISWKG